jgi:N-acetylglucosamine-6-phosphate deacetylase
VNSAAGESTRRLVVQAGAMLLPDRVGGPGFVVTDGERIAHVGEGRHTAPDLDFSGGTLIPGFIDLQINGAAGCDFLSPTEAGLADAHAHLLQSGTVAYLPTFISSSEDRLRSALTFFAGHAGRPGAPRIPGVHLEGPFLSPLRPGAHRPEHLRAPSVEWIARLVDDFQGLIRVVTLAPELDGALEVVDWLVAHGVVVAVGHSDATYAQATAAFDHGARLATHLFNAMRPVHHREPGIVGAALVHPRVTCSIIADLIHLHPAVAGLVTTAKGTGRTALITDAIAAAGVSLSEVPLGDRVVRIADGAPRLADGTLAGSVLQMDQAVRNLARSGEPWDRAVRMASLTPASLLGLEQGQIRPGFRADLAILDRDLAVTAVIVGGEVAR